jgi:histidinol dehydrogenase
MNFQIHNNRSLSELDRRALLVRPYGADAEAVAAATAVLDTVARDGDEGVRSLAKKFDNFSGGSFRVSAEAINAAHRTVPAELLTSIRSASRRIGIFHTRQIPQRYSVETDAGVVCSREWRPLSSVGLYIPGGTAPLISTVLMLGIPAHIAGCERVILCTPPSPAGEIAPEILAAAAEVGITEIYAIGGAQAIAAMAIGTASVPKVDKIFGPGNRYVSAAKSLVTLPPYNRAIDGTAGPSELLVIADESAPPAWIAADLLSQAEHGPGSQVVLVSPSEALVRTVVLECEKQIATLPRAEFLRESLNGSFALIVGTIEEAIAFSNEYAPEHLQLAVQQSEQFAASIRNAGSVFLGYRSSVVFGDYASGTNHTLPTNGSARAAGGVTVESFMKSISFQSIEADGLPRLIPDVEVLARSERLEAHARAAAMRGTA